MFKVIIISKQIYGQFQDLQISQKLRITGLGAWEGMWELGTQVKIVFPCASFMSSFYLWVLLLLLLLFCFGYSTGD